MIGALFVRLILEAYDSFPITTRCREWSSQNAYFYYFSDLQEIITFSDSNVSVLLISGPLRSLVKSLIHKLTDWRSDICLFVGSGVIHVDFIHRSNQGNPMTTISFQKLPSLKCFAVASAAGS